MRSITKINPQIKAAVLPLAVLALFSSGASASLVENGDFSNGISGWQNTSSNFGGNWSSASWEISDDSPMDDAFKMTATAGENYNFRFAQDIALMQDYSNFVVSFDWKVPIKETPWGGNFITIDFLDATGVIGRTAAIDTSNSVHTLDYWRGSIPVDAFFGIHKYRETFDWESFLVDTSSLLPGLDETAVERISVTLYIQNNAGSGGSMFVDNVSITGTPFQAPSPPTWPLLLGGVVAILGRRSRKSLAR